MGRRWRILVVMVAALIAGMGLAFLMEARAVSQFALVSGPDGMSAWRLDRNSGSVSVCGAALAGRALAEAEERLSQHIEDTGGNAQALAALGPEIDALDRLERPRCSPWSRP